MVNVFYKRFRVKQYLKGGRAMRIETVINSPRDLRRNARLPNLAELQDKARAINRRVLDAERASQGTVLASLGGERAHRHRGQADLEPDLGRRAGPAAGDPGLSASPATQSRKAMTPVRLSWPLIWWAVLDLNQ